MHGLLKVLCWLAADALQRSSAVLQLLQGDGADPFKAADEGLTVFREVRLEDGSVINCRIDQDDVSVGMAGLDVECLLWSVAAGAPGAIVGRLGLDQATEVSASVQDWWMFDGAVSRSIDDLVEMHVLAAWAHNLPSAELVREHLPPVIAMLDCTLPAGHPALTPHALYRKDEEGGWTWGGSPELNKEQQAMLEECVRSRKQVFAYSMKDLPGYTGDMGPFRIELDTKDPIFSKPRRYSPLEREAETKKCSELEEAGMIVPCSVTKYASCPTMPAKKNAEGEWVDIRYCIDYRAVNERTIPDRYGMPLAEEVFRELAGKKILSSCDLRSGFHQLPIAEESQPATAFWWGHKLYAWQRLSFGLRNSPAWFQKVMDYEINKAGLGGKVFAYIDDLVLATDTVEEHVELLGKMFDMLLRCGLRIHPEKSVFGAAVISYLGHNLSADGLTPQEAKVIAIRDMPAPKNVSELKSQLGFCGYYRCYVPDYSRVAQPLNELMKQGVAWRWNTTEQQAMDALKRELCIPGKVLRHFDVNRPTIVHTDWSKQGISGVLGQLDDEGKEYLVACVSRSLNKHEQQYSSYEGELLAVVWAVKMLRPMLHGVKFTLVSDHQPLSWLLTAQDLTGKAARCVGKLGWVANPR